MAQERISMRKINEVLRLHFEAKVSQTKIASSVGISRHTVQQYLMRAIAAGLTWQYQKVCPIKNLNKS